MFESIKGWLDVNNPEVAFRGPVEFDTKRLHTANVVKMALAIADLKHSACDRELLRICALYHDVGRVKQFKEIGSFNDRLLAHRPAGLEMLDAYIEAHEEDVHVNGENPYEVQLLRAVIYGHGAKHLVQEWKVLSIPEAKEILDIISDADDIENGISAISYLIDEAKKDAKGYNQNNPEHIGKINPELFEYYRTGTKFNKFELCHSYAEYFLFAGMLAMNAIKNYGVLARESMKMPMYGYANVVAGYEDVFHYAMSEEDANCAIAIMKEAVYG